ncbi:MAG: iron-containing alcohol dehydrogenase, partial [Caulobacterales bacterium]|nr:iron-containing alcohol dehydrogenase [Caulobacterales bacterium]
DLAKAVCLLAGNGGALGDYDLAGPDPKPVGPIAPLLVIPTTAGTGTEVSVGCVIHLSDGHKGIIDNPNLIPHGVLCDPSLTISLPARLTAATGMDALSHCIEGFVSNIANPLTEPVALDGVRRIASALETAVNEPADMGARSDMMWGALAGGLAMSMELGAAHGMSVPLGARFHAHHGALTAAVLGEALRFNEPAAPAAIAQVRQALGAPADADLCEWMNGLCARVGLSTRLRDHGVARETLGEVAEEAAAGVFNDTNPRRGSTQDYRDMLERRW